MPTKFLSIPVRRAVSTIVLLVFLGAVGLSCSAPSRCAVLRQVSIADGGAVGDGVTLNTSRIQSAIDDLASKGGGTLVVPSGEFLTGALFLKPGVDLHLEAGAVLKGSPDKKDYPRVRTRVEGLFPEWLPALINADRCDHLRITGSGTLDGNGPVFYAEFWAARQADPDVTNLAVERPRLIFIRNSAGVQISGITLKDSGFWNLHLYRCTDALIENVRFESPGGRPPTRGPSTDGVDIDSCQGVTVRGCTFSVGDDCVALKGTRGPFAREDKSSPPTRRIRVENCTFNEGHGAVTLGSDACIVRDVVVQNCRVTGRMPLVRIKVRPDTPQHYEDIHFRDITLDGGGAIIEWRPWMQFFDLKGQSLPTQLVKNVTVSGVKGTFGSFGEIVGKPETRISRVTLEDIDVNLRDEKLKVGKVNGLEVRNVRVNGKPVELTFIP